VGRWQPPGYLPPVTIEGAMQTPDGAWRVEATRRRREYWYRIVHGKDVMEGLSIAGVLHILTEAGVDVATLIEVDPSV
jgi:hypothetical protein